MQFQPGELAKIFLIVFLAGYLRDKREALAQGRLKDLGPLLVIWGAAMLVLVQTSDLGSALLNFGIFLAMVYVATGRALYVGVGIAPLPRGLGGALQRARPCPAARHRLAASLDGRPGLLLDQRQARLPPELRLVPAREEPLLDRERRLRRHRAREGHVHDGRRDAADPVPEHRLRLLGDRTGAGADRRRRDAPGRDGDRGARDADRPDRAGRVLEAARRRAHVRARPADVHHRRRRPPRRPADGHHASVRLVRRLVDRLQLRHARPAPPRLEPCRGDGGARR